MTSLEFITMATGDDKQSLGPVCRESSNVHEKRRHTLLTEHGKISPGEGESSVCSVLSLQPKKGKGKGKGKGKAAKAASAVIDGVSTDDMTTGQV